MTRYFRLAGIATTFCLVAARPLVSQVAATDSTHRADSASTVVAAAPGPLMGANRSGIGPELQDTVARPRAIEYSDLYNTRLTIHRYASYAELPLFAAEWVVGQKLLTETQSATYNRHNSSIKSAHSALAAGLGGLFAVNTVTGLWNLYDSRHDPAGRTRRILHSVMMLAADAGFAYTASIAGDARRTDAGASNHRSAALVSMGVATASTVMMWLWKN